MNDVSFEIDDRHKLKMFADDSTIFVASRTLEYVNQQLENCLKPISSWIRNHGMASNVAKTESMVISARPKLARLQGQRIQITHNGTEIKSVDTNKLLGLVLDEQLTWTKYNLDRILRLQKYAARVTLNIKRPKDVPSSELFSKLNHKSSCRLFCVHNDE